MPATHRYQSAINITMKQNNQSRPTLRPLLSFTETFESSQQEKEERFLLDKALARGIVENNSSLIVEEHRESLDNGSLTYDQDGENDRLLFEYRIKYDKVKTETLALEAKINLEKQEKSRLEAEHQLLSTSKRNTEKACKDMENQLSEQSYGLDQTVLSFDCRKAMQERLKSDIIHYKKRIFDANIQLIKKRSEVKMQGNSFMRQKKLSVRCKHLLSSVEKTLHHNQMDRSFKIDDVKGALSSKQEHLLRQRQRQYNIHKSMMAALNEKLPQEKELLKLLYSNKLLKRILHCKMEALMKSYQEVSTSFNQIKANTSVKTAQDFVDKYLTKNVIYGQLSESISKLEPKIGELEKERDDLLAERTALMAISEELAEKFRDKKDLDLKKAEEQVSVLNQRIEKINKYRNSWTNWALSTVAMFRAVPRSEIRSKYDYLGNLLGDTLRMLLKHLNQQEEKEASISQEALEKQLAKGKVKLNDLIVRNVRIKTLGNELSHREDDDVEYDLLSEKDYLQHARRAVKKQRYARNMTITRA